MAADINFYFDPLCPFAWMTSKWVRKVAAQRDYTVEWRFISLRMLNADVDYGSHFPAGYEAGHTAGLRLLRVAARARAEHGRKAVGPLYEAIGDRAFDSAAAPALGPEERGSREFIEPLLEQARLPAELADALDDASWDAELRVETDEALALTGKDVGTPIIHFGPPDGTAFFGPVISRLPSDQDAIRLWDHVVGLASFPGFAELKRSLRERPQLRSFGVSPGQTGIQEDWHGGSRRLKKLRRGTSAPTVSTAEDDIDVVFAINVKVPFVLVGEKGTAELPIDEFAALAPAGRPTSPDEIAAVITYLASDEASFVHGAIFAVDGGRTAP